MAYEGLFVSEVENVHDNTTAKVTSCLLHVRLMYMSHFQDLFQCMPHSSPFLSLSVQFNKSSENKGSNSKMYQHSGKCFCINITTQLI